MKLESMKAKKGLLRNRKLWGGGITFSTNFKLKFSIFFNYECGQQTMWSRSTGILTSVETTDIFIMAVVDCHIVVFQIS